MKIEMLEITAWNVDSYKITTLVTRTPNFVGEQKPVCCMFLATFKNNTNTGKFRPLFTTRISPILLGMHMLDIQLNRNLLRLQTRPEK